MSKRTILAILICTLWLAAMGWLVYRENSTPVLRTTETPDDRLAGIEDTWMGLFTSEDDRVGHVHLRRSPITVDGLEGVEMELEAAMTLNLLGRNTSLELGGTVWRPYDEKRADFNFNVSSAEYNLQVGGQVANGRLSGEVTSAAEKFPLDMEVDDNVLFANFGTAMTFPKLAVGDEFKMTSFDPMTLRPTPAKVRCIDEQVIRLAGRMMATQILEVDSNGFKAKVWVDGSGEVVQAETPLGLTMRLIEPQDVREAITGEADELLQLTSVQPSGKKVFRGARRAVLKIAEGPDRELPSDDVQRFADGMLEIVTPSAPAPGGEVTADEEFLASDPFVQSSHPKIQEQSATIVGDESDPWQKALAIYDWVYTKVEKEPVVSIPSALEVLANLRGDCNEHTVLYTALARAAGLPTRIAIGLVWSDTLNGYYYHAWPEVRINDTWFWLDPTLGQPMADATHIKILNGGIERWTQLLPYIGQLEIEVVEID